MTDYCPRCLKIEPATVHTCTPHPVVDQITALQAEAVEFKHRAEMAEANSRLGQAVLDADAELIQDLQAEVARVTNDINVIMSADIQTARKSFRVGAESALRWAFDNSFGEESDLGNFIADGIRAVCGEGE